MKRLLSFKYISAIYQLLFLFISLKPSKSNSTMRYRLFLILSASINYIVSNYLVHEFEKSVYNPDKKRKLKILEFDRASNYLVDKLGEAYFDELTGLFNRKAFEEELIHLKGSSLSVVMFDIDHFKKINDTYGHQEGDRILKELGELISNVVSSFDDAQGNSYRYGGEEFVILLPNQKKMTATIVARTLRQEVANKISINQLPVTISLGVSSGRNPKKLIKIADKALYSAKRNGRNQVQTS